MKVRKASRAIILNPENKIFLFKFEFAMLSDHKTLWATPGGGLEGEESFEQALVRELHEELGITFEGIFKWIYFRNMPFKTAIGEEFLSEERYFLVKLDDSDISFENFTQIEKELTRDWKWWSVEELRSSNESFFAENLSEKLGEIIDGRIPDEPVEI